MSVEPSRPVPVKGVCGEELCALLLSVLLLVHFTKWPLPERNGAEFGIGNGQSATAAVRPLGQAH